MTQSARTGLFALLALFSLVLAACTPATTPTPADDNAGPYTVVTGSDVRNLVAPQQFESEEQLKAFIRQNQDGSISFYGRNAIMESAPSMAPMADAVTTSAGSKAAGGAGSSQSFSTTNNQVAAVDEADIIKTDGNYIYTVSGNTLFVIKAYPGAEAQVVSKLDLKNQPTGLFIDGDRLAVFGNFYDLDYFKKLDIRPRNGMTYFTIYDISNKEKLSVVKDYKFEGNYFDARMSGDHVYFAATSSLNIAYPTPMVIDSDVMSSVPVRDVYFFPIPYNSVQYVTIHAVNLKNPAVSSKTVAVEGTNTLYMSEENIYLAYTKYINEYTLRQDILENLIEAKLTAADRALIAKIEAADDEVLSPQEKESKVSQVYNDYVNYMSSDEQQALNDDIDEALKKELAKYDSYEYTVITKLSADNGNVKLVATGQVPGHVNNQFSLDENEGVLRIATTTSPRFWGWIRPMMMEDVAVAAVAPDAPVATDDAKMIAPGEPSPSQSLEGNNVYTLDADLKVLDKLEGLAKGETIYSTRFMGDRLYMVTFKQVDPFFVIDLSDANNIKELGKLKIPGFSRYLHPYDDNTIIGIGRDASATGRTQGLKVSLFDVSNPEKPVELAKWEASDDYSQSTAEYEHKAFLFDKEKELLVIPAYSYDWSKGSGVENYNGAMVFKIARDDIELRGIIDHGTGQQYYGPTVERSLWINELLYTKSTNLLRINKIDDLSSVKKITLDGTSSGPYPIY